MKTNHQNRLYCPTCREGQRNRPKDLVCPDCYKKYTEEAGRALARGEAISIPEWVMGIAGEQLATLQAEFHQKQNEYTALQERVGEEAFQEIRSSLKGKSVPQEVFNSALRQKKDELWKANKGNRLHFEVKTLEKQIAFIEGLLSELQTKAEEFAERTRATEGSPADADDPEGKDDEDGTSEEDTADEYDEEPVAP